LKVLVSGSTGLIASALIPALEARGDTVVRLVRSAPRPGGLEVRWEPMSDGIDRAGLHGIEAVVHLAGEPISGIRWTGKKKARIRDSRVQGTRLLAEAVASLSQPPKVFVVASGIGFYGDRGPEVLSEDSGCGVGFLAELAEEWEAASEPAARSGVRVVPLRTGIVLSRHGGTLPVILPPFKLGLGGVLGSGSQYWSWVDIADLVSIIKYVLRENSIEGPLNACAPNPVTNRAFTRVLGKVLGRPTLVRVPRWLLVALQGELALELMLSSARAVPARLDALGFNWGYPDLENSFRHVLDRG
jgi:uncharacterized protein (TIGR01777 family)